MFVEVFEYIQTYYKNYYKSVEFTNIDNIDNIDCSLSDECEYVKVTVRHKVSRLIELKSYYIKTKDAKKIIVRGE